MACATPSILGPLSFPEPEPVILPFDFAPWENCTISCLLCSEQFTVPSEVKPFSDHLNAAHCLVIPQLDQVVSIKGYVDYWRIRFQQVGVQDTCPKFAENGRIYYLLSPAINHEDISLRRGLIQKRLEWVLEVQKKEHEDRGFGRACIFCRHVESGTRPDYLNHLVYEHNVHLGSPRNIVFVDKFIDKIESTLKQLKCIYCELVFRDREVLKEHMRKKFHKRINPNLGEYDRFYVSGYVEERNNDVEERERRILPEDCSDWSQWREEGGADWSDWKEEPPAIVCLFCAHTNNDWGGILQHMHEVHRFSYKFVMAPLEFHEQLKIVNFIRREVHLCRCYECKSQFPDQSTLFNHMTAAGHCILPDRSDWDHPELFFSTYENDTFLCCLEDKDDNESPEDPTDSLARQISGFNIQM